MLNPSLDLDLEKLNPIPFALFVLILLTILEIFCFQVDGKVREKTKMFVKEMVIDGFKSYGQRTEIKGFDHQFNAITGLNG